MATAREFALVLRLVPERIDGKSIESKKGGRKGAESTATAQPLLPAQQKRQPKAMLMLARLEKALNGRGFSVRLADSQEIMRLLAVYFTQNVTTDQFEDFDGQRFALE